MHKKTIPRCSQALWCAMSLSAPCPGFSISAGGTRTAAMMSLEDLRGDE